MIPIPAMFYSINDPDSQRSVCGMGRPTYLKVGNALYKIYISNYTNFLKIKSHPILPVEGLKLFLNFLCSKGITQQNYVKFATIHRTYQMRFFFSKIGIV